MADWRNDRIQKFTPDGQFLAKFGGSGSGDGRFHRPSKVAVDSEGYIYVADWGNERVQVLRPDGGFQLKLRGEATISKWAQDFLDANSDESVERDKSNLFPELPPHLDTPYLISSQIESYFWGPVSVSLDMAGRLYVTESSRPDISKGIAAARELVEPSPELSPGGLTGMTMSWLPPPGRWLLSLS